MKHFGHWLANYDGNNSEIQLLKEDFLSIRRLRKNQPVMYGDDSIEDFVDPDSVRFEMSCWSASDEAVASYELAVAEFESSEG